VEIVSVNEEENDYGERAKKLKMTVNR